MSAATASVDERRQRWRAVRHALLLIVGLVLAWQALYLWVGDIALASPLETVRYAARLLATDTFYPHLRDTMLAFAAGYALAVVLGLSIGFWLGFHRLSGEVMEPMVVAVYSLPKVTLYPILLLAFGLGISAKIAFHSSDVFVRAAARMRRWSSIRSSWAISGAVAKRGSP